VTSGFWAFNHQEMTLPFAVIAQDFLTSTKMLFEYKKILSYLIILMMVVVVGAAAVADGRIEE